MRERSLGSPEYQSLRTDYFLQWVQLSPNLFSLKTDDRYDPDCKTLVEENEITDDIEFIIHMLRSAGMSNRQTCITLPKHIFLAPQSKHIATLRKELFSLHDNAT
jgi:hypothetical protein